MKALTLLWPLMLLLGGVLPGPALAQDTAAWPEVVIQDLGGFGQPMPAARVRIPPGWRSEGGISWTDSRCMAGRMQTRWRTSSPDGQTAVEMLPGLSWQLSGTQISMNPCPALPLPSLRAYLESFVRQERPEARVLDYRDRPDLAQKQAAMNRSQGGAPPGVRQWVESGQILIGYQSGGRDLRELFSATASFSQMQGNVVGGSASVSAVRAPNGQLDMALAERIGATMKADPAWLDQVRRNGERALAQDDQQQKAMIQQWHAQRMAAINTKYALQRAQDASGTRAIQATGAAQTAIYQSNSATDDQIQRRSLEAIGSYNTYDDPVDKAHVIVPIEPNAGERVLRLDSGDYLRTGDPYLNPAGSVELQQIP